MTSASGVARRSGISQPGLILISIRVLLGPLERACSDPKGRITRANQIAIPKTNIVPAATKTKPTTRGIRRPDGTTFSSSTRAERAAIQSRFITPPTKSSIIRAQQQPIQASPCLSPSRRAPIGSR